jgi:uncharacterized protein YfiM (DUF2279 family)
MKPRLKSDFGLLLFIVVFLAICFLSLPSRAQKLDNNTLIHFSVGMGVGSGSSIFVNSTRDRLAVGLFTGLVVGATKEFHDSRKKTEYFQWHDMVSTGLGGLLGGWMIDYAIKRNRRWIKNPRRKDYLCKF